MADINDKDLKDMSVKELKDWEKKFRSYIEEGEATMLYREMRDEIVREINSRDCRVRR
jgi:hypothetical protein